MSVILRYVNDNGVVCERLVDLKEVRDKTGAGQAAAVIASVDQNGMDKDRIAFQSYDFTNSMSSELNGAQAIVSQTLGGRVPYISCQAHRSNTINEHACDASPIVSELFDTLQAVYVFFVRSTKRFSLLHDELEKIENALALRNLSATRWTARAESLKAMWVSYDGVLDVLRKIDCSSSVDAKGKALATGLLANLLRVDFVVSLMFMRLVLWKTKVLTEVFQGENLNIIDALNAIKATITSLEVIRGDDVGIRNQIEASVAVLSGKGVDVNAKFSRLHRPRRQPRRLDDNPQSMAEIPISTFYDREFKAVLDIFIEQYKENLEKCLEKVRSLFTILLPPLRSDHEDDVFNDLLGLFPKNTPDIAAFIAEFEIFVSAISEKSGINTFKEAAEQAEKMRRIFPITNRIYRLALTAPVTVAQNERTFSKLKTMKTILRNSTSDGRLFDLILLSVGKDLADEIELDVVVEK